MIWIYRLRLRQLLSASAWFAACGAVLTLLLMKLLPFDRKTAYTMALPVLAVAAQIFALLSFSWLPSNFGWLLAAPLSKRSLVVLHGLLNVTAVAAFNAAAVMAALIAYLLAFGAAGAAGFFEVPAFCLKLLTLLLGKALFDPNFYPPLATLWPLALLFLLATTPRLGLIQQMGARRAPVSSRKRAAIAAGVLGFIVLCVAAARGRWPIAVLVLLAAAIVSAAVAMTWRAQMALSPRQTRLCIAVSLAVGLLPLLALTLEAERLRTAGTPAVKAAAIAFLGGLAPGASREELASLLGAGLDPLNFQRIGGLYQDRFNGGRPLDAGQEPFVRFRDLLAAASSAQAPDVVGLFDPSTFGKDDLAAYDAAIPSTTGNLGRPLRWLRAKLTAEDLLELLRSKNETDAAYALLRLRYERAPRAVGEILRDMPRYSGWDVSLALTTLSILAGQKLTLEALPKTRVGVDPGGLFRRVDCASFAPRSKAELETADPGVLNACVRERADRADLATLSRLELFGWLDPSRPEHRALAASVLGIR